MPDFGQMRREMIAASVGRSVHLPSAFSILEIVWAVYEVMGADDEFILSKGHGSLALYAVLKAQGLIDGNIFDLPGHPDARKVPGVILSTGSLGHGLAVAAGMALARKIKSAPGRMFVLLGDGECMEGSVYEACLLMDWWGLNVIAIVDNNKSHPLYMGNNFEADYYRCKGHDAEELASCIDCDGPAMIIADTVKGHGCRIFEDDPEAWHHRSPKEDELEMLLEATPCAP